jgi:spore coat protein U-like protein
MTNMTFACTAASIAALMSTAAFAATPLTTNFTVQIRILDACSVGTPASLDFGSQSALTANQDQTTSIQVTCSLTTPYHIGLDQGLNGASVSTRKMKGATSADTVTYALYRDTLRTANWGNTVSTDTIDAIGTGLPISHTVYGRVPSQTTPRPDTYTDTITVTVNY